jgi:tRNA pseudouridine55 synthase
MARGTPVDGVLLLDKPLGLTSNAALQRAKRAAGAARAGHIGTLDPLATGLLPVCFGEATKFSQGLTDADKTYVASVRLGATTTTGDAEGEILTRGPVDTDEPRLRMAIASLQGPQDQVPPMHSAVKHRGRPLYDYARAGEVVVRPARRITIHQIALERWAPPDAEILVRCSKGTYVRTLAETLGERLGCGAHLAGLRRVAVGPLSLDAAVTLDVWEALSLAERLASLLPADRLVADLPLIELDPSQTLRFCQGQTITVPRLPLEGSLRVYTAGEGRFLGLGTTSDGAALAPLRLVAQSPAAAEAFPRKSGETA